MPQAVAATQKAAALAALRAAGGVEGQKVVVQAGHAASDEARDLVAADVAAQVITSGGNSSREGSTSTAASSSTGVYVVNNIDRMHQLLAQCTYQPGLGRVLSQVLMQSEEGAEFYVQVGGAMGWVVAEGGGDPSRMQQAAYSPCGCMESG